MPKPSIPPIPKSSVGTDRQQFDVVVKELLETVTAQRGTAIQALPATANLADVIRKINEVIARLQ